MRDFEELDAAIAGVRDEIGAFDFDSSWVPSEEFARGYRQALEDTLGNLEMLRRVMRRG